MGTFEGAPRPRPGEMKALAYVACVQSQAYIIPSFSMIILSKKQRPNRDQEEGTLLVDSCIWCMHATQVSIVNQINRCIQYCIKQVVKVRLIVILLNALMGVLLSLTSLSLCILISYERECLTCNK